MKIALLSDVHANLRALQACLAHAAGQGADRLAVMGDHVGYGAQPAEVVRHIRGLAGEGAIVLKGNHDEYAVAPPAQAHSADQSGAAWTHEHLDKDALDFLAALPLTARADAALLVHASADAPERWQYVDSERRAEASLNAACLAMEVRYVFCGHVHQNT